MKIAHLLPAVGLSSALLAASAFAGSDTILSCKGEDWSASFNRTASGVEIVEITTLTNFETHVKRDETMRANLTLLGRSSLGYKEGPYAGNNPVAALVDLKNPGKNYAYFALANAKAAKTHTMNLAMNDGRIGLNRDGDCSEGPAYAAFAAKMKAAPVVSKTDFSDYRDDQMAMRCKPTAKGDAGVQYAVRALHMGFADSEIQVSPSNSTSDFPASLDHFDASGDTIRWVQGEGTIQYPPVPRAMMFSLKTTPKTVAGKKSYSAEYFDGKGSSVALTCAPRWSMESNIFKAVEEKNSKKSVLPAPGKITDAKKELCDQGDALEKILGQYDDLIMKTPGVNGVGLGAFQPKKSPFGIRCYKISVMVTEDKDLAAAKAAIGESFLGFLVDYEVVGVIRAQ